MSFSGFLVLVVLGGNEPYVRTRVASDPEQCLWWKSPTITYQQSVVGNPATTGETEFASVEYSFNTWQRLSDSCGLLHFVQGPRTTERTIGQRPQGPNANVVLFRFGSCNKKAPATASCWADGSCGNTYDCWEHSNGALALTTVSYQSSSGAITDADIELNASAWTFTTVDTPVCTAKPTQTCVATDVQNTLTHEIGHFLGLDHTGRVESTMYTTAPVGEIKKRVLDEGTQSFVCTNYPKGGAPVLCKDVPAELPLNSGPADQPKTGCSATGSREWIALTALLLLARRRPRTRRCGTFFLG